MSLYQYIMPIRGWVEQLRLTWQPVQRPIRPSRRARDSYWHDRRTRGTPPAISIPERRTIMTPSGDNRSVQAGSIIGSNVVTGDQNTVTSTIHVALPPAGTVDPQAELAALRQALAGLQTPERGKLDRALQDAEEEA